MMDREVKLSVKNLKILYKKDLDYVFDYIKEIYNLKENEFYKLYNNIKES